MKISVINFDEEKPQERILEVIRAINIQIERDFAPYWHMSAELRLDSPDPKRDVDGLTGMRGDAVLYIVPRPNAEYLGYHKRHADGVPFGFVFTGRAGQNWTAALSHEALEILADPHCNLTCKGPHPDPEQHGREVFHWYEVCDPVQAETYDILDVSVSNFVLPLYFTGGDELDGRNDFLDRRNGPRLRSFSAKSGGYVGFHDPLAPGASKRWFPDDTGKSSFDLKSSAIPDGFRRANRRDRAHPIVITDMRDKSLPAGVAAVRGLHVHYDGSTTLDELHASISTQLGPDFTLEVCPYLPDTVVAEGPAFVRPLHEVWSAVANLCHLSPDICLEERVDQTSVGDEARASGRGGSTCPCDEDEPPKGSASKTWALDRTNILAAQTKLRMAHPMLQPGHGILIAHPDTGYTDYLKKSGRIAPGGHDFVRRQADARDPLPHVGRPGHGTRTGSVLVGPAEQEFIGVAPGARLVPYRISWTPALLDGKNLAMAIHAAVERKVDIISMSVGTITNRRWLRDAVARAHAANVILVAAAGNCIDRLLHPRSGFTVFPARYPECIACAAIGPDDRLWCGTSDTPEVDVYAPGDSVWCYTPENSGPPGFVRRRGTSFATALVAGTAALWLHHHGREELLKLCNDTTHLNDIFRAALLASGRPMNDAVRSTNAGILDAAKLLDLDPGALSVRARPSDDALGRLAALFPGLTRSEFETRIASTLAFPTDQLADISDKHEPELDVLLATDDRLRAAILGVAPRDEEFGSQPRPDAAPGWLLSRDLLGRTYPASR